MMQPLWPHLDQVTLVEYKSPSRGYRPTELLRLCSYGLQYFIHYHKEQSLEREALTLVLIVPSVGQALREDAAFLQLSWHTLQPGYYRLSGNPLALYVVSADKAAQVTDDDWLRLLGNQPLHRAETVAWYGEWLVYYEKYAPAFAQSEEFQRMRYKVLESMTPEERIAGLSPKERIAGLPPKELGAALSSLTPEEQFLALPDEVLRSLPSDYIDSLPARVRRELRKRLTSGRSKAKQR